MFEGSNLIGYLHCLKCTTPLLGISDFRLDVLNPTIYILTQSPVTRPYPPRKEVFLTNSLTRFSDAALRNNTATIVIVILGADCIQYTFHNYTRSPRLTSILESINPLLSNSLYRSSCYLFQRGAEILSSCRAHHSRVKLVPLIACGT